MPILTQFLVKSPEMENCDRNSYMFSYLLKVPVKNEREKERERRTFITDR